MDTPTTHLYIYIPYYSQGQGGSKTGINIELLTTDKITSGQNSKF